MNKLFIESDIVNLFISLYYILNENDVNGN